MTTATASDLVLPASGRFSGRALAVVLWLLTLWDFYVGPATQGFRPFDFVAVGLLTSVLVAEAAVHPVRRFRIQYVFPGRVLAIVSLLMAANLAGAILDPVTNSKVAIGVGVGIGLFCFCSGAVLSREFLIRVTNAILLAHAAFLGCQAITYFLTGGVLNYHAVVGGTPRVLGRLFRPSGLFLEPAHYGVFALMLLSLRLRLRPRADWIVWIGAGSVLLTLSIYGVATVLVLLLLYLWRTRVLWVVAVVAVVVAAANAQRVAEAGAVVFVVDRLSNLDADISAQQRYAGLDLVKQAFQDPTVVFGRGLSNDYERFGANGLAFLLNAVGLAGFLLFCFLYAGLAQPGERLRTVLVLGLAMAGASRWTVWLWWAWLGLYINPTLLPDAEAT